MKKSEFSVRKRYSINVSNLDSERRALISDNVKGNALTLKIDACTPQLRKKQKKKEKPENYHSQFSE